MLVKISQVGMKAVALCVPKDNPSIGEYDISHLDERQIKRFSEHTGFERLRIADKGTQISDLCVGAAEVLFKEFPEKDEIDGLVFVTTTPNWTTPATSHYIRYRLGLRESCWCFDVNEACSGYVAGYYLACSLIKGGQCRKVLFLCGDVTFRHTDPYVSATHLLFGTGGSATLIGAMNVDNYFNNKTFGDKYQAVIAPYDAFNGKRGHLTMDGGTVTSFAMNDVPNAISELLGYAKLTKDDISMFACHQANRLILNALAKKLGVAQDKVPFLSSQIGNLASSSIPAMLSLHPNPSQSNVMLCGFGSGLAGAFCITDFTMTKFLGMSEYEKSSI